MNSMSQQGASWPRLTTEERAAVDANLGLVGFVLSGMIRGTPSGRWVDDEYEDAWQDGVLGLMRATQKFDPALGYRFSTYATIWIRQTIQRGRMTARGLNYRAARRDGRDFELPLPLHGDGQPDAPTLDDVLQGRDLEPRVIDSVLLDAMRAEVATWDLDEIDRAIVDGLFVLTDDAQIHRDATVAERFGRSVSGIVNRRKRIQARLRSWAGESVVAA